MTIKFDALWRSNFSKRPISASVAVGVAAVLGAMALLVALIVCAIAGVLGALAWAGMRFAPRPQQASSSPAGSGQVLEARQTAQGWVVEATRGG